MIIHNIIIIHYGASLSEPHLVQRMDAYNYGDKGSWFESRSVIFLM